MHTCALHPDASADLFGDMPEPQPPQLEFTGTLAAPPVIRTRSDHGRPVPVLCVELQGVGPHGHTLHAEVPFTEDQRKAAEAQANTLRAGQRVAVTTPITTLRLSLPQATSVALAAD